VTAPGPDPPSRGFYDEARDAEGEPREVGGAGLGLLGGDLPAHAARVPEALDGRGVSFRSAGGATEFLVDPVPRRLVETSEGYEPALRGVRPAGGAWIGVAGLDLVPRRPRRAARARGQLGQLLAPPVRAGTLGVVNAFGTGVAAGIARPEDFIAQPTIEISLHPTVIGDELQPRHVDLRPLVFMHGAGNAVVMPGGLTRVAFGEGAMAVNSTQNGGAKDTWVLS